MKRPNLKKKKLIPLITILLLLGGGILSKVLTGSKISEEINEYIVSAESGTLPGLVTASGELQAEKSVNVSPKRQGILEEIYVNEGDNVVKGQLIGRMDYGELVFQIEEFKSDYETQKASYERRKILLMEGAISSEQFDEYKNRFLKSEAKLKQFQLKKDELKIRAPFQGVITSRYAVPGAFVTPTTSASASPNGGSTSSSIVELSQGIEAIAKVPESDIGRIKAGQEALLRVDAFPDELFKASVSRISPRAIKSNNVTSFEVTLLLKDNLEKLRIGMTSDIEFQTGPSKINVLVPTVAIVTKKGRPGVLLIDENYQPKFKQVELGNSSGSKTAIISGVSPGEKIFISLPPWAKQKQD